MKYSIIVLCLIIGLTGGTTCGAAVFGEVALTGGVVMPQGTFNRYADNGELANLRLSMHIPHVEMFVGWIDFEIGQFSRDEFETYKITQIVGGPTLYDPETQVTSEDLIAGHIGLQLASMSQNAFFRPRAALGIGLYGFSHKIEWKEDVGDSTVVIASENLHRKTCWGWRASVGADLFFTPQWGATFNVVYDHVLKLRQKETLVDLSNNTSRFNGFTVGIIYMFSTKKHTSDGNW